MGGVKVHSYFLVDMEKCSIGLIRFQSLTPVIHHILSSAVMFIMNTEHTYTALYQIRFVIAVRAH